MGIDKIFGSFTQPAEWTKEQAAKRAMQEAAEAKLCVFMGLDAVRVRKSGKEFYKYDAMLQKWTYSVVVGDPEDRD